MTDFEEIFSNQSLELRRGTLVLAILSQLGEPRYGYALLQTLEELSFVMDAGTLYPLLRRLDKQGIIKGEWETVDNRPRKYYQLTAQGRKLYDRLLIEWAELSNKLNTVIHPVA